MQPAKEIEMELQYIKYDCADDEEIDGVCSSGGRMREASSIGLVLENVANVVVIY